MKLLAFAKSLIVGGSMLCVLMFSPNLRAQIFSEQGTTILGGANYASRSASLADIDGDGDLDLLFQGGSASGVVARQLFRNNLISTGTPSFTFTNITSTMLPSGSAALGDSWSAAWGDYDGDGKVDVFVGQTNSGTSGDVLKNNGASAFTNTSSATGLNDPGFHQNVAWADIDADLDLDLLIGMEGPEKNAVYLHNWATHTFNNVGAAVGFQADVGIKAYGMAIGDTDGDGDLDVYISTCRGDNNIRNNFYQNMLKENGSLSFVDIADSNGTQFMTNSYGAEFVDFDNDGKLDLFMTGADGEPSKIFRNDGNNLFTDVDSINQNPLLSSAGTDLNGFKAIDYDNDGDLDLYFHDNLSPTGNQKLYRNNGNWLFTDVTLQEGLNSVASAGAYDSVWGDLDRDGDQDLIVPNTSANPERVYVSDASANGNHWLYIKLAGPAQNTTAVGASLYATMNDGSLDGITLRREANTNAGTFNQSDVPVHFGLGTSTVVDWLRVVWPDGTVQFLHNVAANQYLNLSYTTALTGDFNGDGTVDAADYVVWRDNLGSPFKPSDYGLWKSNFGRSLENGSGSFANVPEPANLGLLFLATTLIIYSQRRGNRL